MNHTPGPWTVNGNIGRKSELGIMADAAPCIIATMGNQKEWPAEAEANARLIAAAPDLLAALQEAREAIGVALDMAQRHNPDTGTYHSVEPIPLQLTVRPAFFHAGQAIAKAVQP